MKNKNYILILIIFLMLFSGCSRDSNHAVTINTNPVDQYGNLEVAIQDQTTTPINLYLSESIANITLNANYNIGDKVISINSPVAPVADNLICLKEGSHFFQEEIVSVTSLGANNYQVTLRSPLDFAYTTAGGCSIRNNNLAVNGGVTPRTFTLSPKGLNVSWHINKVIFHCEDNAAMDSSKFCGIAELPNGLVLTRVNGVTKKLLTIESNGDFTEHDAEVIYDDKAPAGVYSLYATKNFNGQNYAGVALYLQNSTNDELKVTVYDDLTGLNHLHVVAIGHVIQE